ncbi:MAG TPA: hypothetical protein PKD10_05425 [Paracoccaceae bacterium]|nr:hypothetical protein [Paracoccaceae bacterium]HMO72539.1 hypothetical protein [Paracoccaceae bacterium]
MKIRKEVQVEAIADEVLALTSVVRPILTGLLYALKADVVEEAGGFENVKLKMLPRLYRPGSGDCGICFEYAVHEALQRQDGRVLERVNDAAQLCNVPGSNLKSLLFGLEKNGALKLIDAANEALNEESLLLYGKRGRPAKLKSYIGTLAGAFRNSRTRLALPSSIQGLWKADLFIGFTDSDRWVATTVKINQNQLAGAEGLRIGIVPNRQGQNDQVRKDDGKNLVICPINHDHDFMQTFYEGWRTVQAFIASDARVPNEAMLPVPIQREVCRLLQERREFPVIDVIEAIAPFGQRGLMETEEEEVGIFLENNQPSFTDLMIAPKGKDVN